MMEEVPQENNQNAIKALAAFCDRFEPAAKEISDYFSSAEIKRLVADHTGYEFDLMELQEMLLNMGYTYELQQDQFTWLCNKIPL